MKFDQKKLVLVLVMIAAGGAAYFLFKPEILSLKERIKGKFK